MRFNRLIWLCSVALISPSFSGCGGSSPAPVGGQLELRPAHLTTNIDGSARPTFVIDFSNGAEGQAPDPLPPPVLHRFGDDQPLNVTTDVVLPVGWYSAVLELTPDQASAWTVAGARVDEADSTRFVSDFHVGSAPVATFAAPLDPVTGDEARRILELRVSESCTAGAGTSPDALITVRINGEAAECRREPQGDGTTSDELQNLRRVVLVCTRGIPDGARVSVDVAPGIVSLTGEPLRDLNGSVSVHADVVAGAASSPRVTDALVTATAAASTGGGV